MRQPPSVLTRACERVQLNVRATMFVWEYVHLYVRALVSVWEYVHLYVRAPVSVWEYVHLSIRACNCVRQGGMCASWQCPR